MRSIEILKTERILGRLFLVSMRFGLIYTDRVHRCIFACTTMLIN